MLEHTANQGDPGQNVWLQRVSGDGHVEDGKPLNRGARWETGSGSQSRRRPGCGQQSAQASDTPGSQGVSSQAASSLEAFVFVPGRLWALRE